jgi:ribosomal protein L35
MKTNKSYTKRIRVTKKGKLVVRKAGQDHFNAKQSGSQRMAKKRDVALQVPNRIRRRFLSTPSK